MNFFSLLKSKLSKNAVPDRNFDQRFWQKFDAEFNTGKRKSAPWFKRLSARWAIPLASAASIAFAILFFQHQKHEQELDILKHEQIVEHLDLFMTFEDVSQLEESDWKMLLHKQDEDYEDDSGEDESET